MRRRPVLERKRRQMCVHHERSTHLSGREQPAEDLAMAFARLLDGDARYVNGGSHMRVKRREQPQPKIEGVQR